MPTNDEIQRAIEYYRNHAERLRNAAQKFHYDGQFRSEQEALSIAQYAEMSITALQAYRQPVGDKTGIRGLVMMGEYLVTLNDENLAAQVVDTNNVQNYINESLAALRQMPKEPCECTWCRNGTRKDHGQGFHFCPNCGRELKGGE